MKQKFSMWKDWFCFPLRLLVLLTLTTGGMVCTSMPAAAAQLRPEVEAFIAEMVEKHAFNRETLERLFTVAEFQPSVIRAISLPATAKPWQEYRAQFVNAQRIAGGAAFWNDHAMALAAARTEYGVPEEIIVAVIGVETMYGAQTGRYRVLDALTTLAFGYPRRAAFFRDELENYLLLAREQGADVLNFRGSYAGAIGIPQFMPSSYRRYAVDFDGDGRIDLSHDAADAIGSVANYLQAFGWEAGQTAAVRVEISDDSAVALTGIEPLRTVGELRKHSVIPPADAADDRPAALIGLENDGATEYWLGFNNFRVIMRYNRSVYYAMAVLQLAEEVRAARDAALR